MQAIRAIGLFLSAVSVLGKAEQEAIHWLKHDCDGSVAVHQLPPTSEKDSLGRTLYSLRTFRRLAKLGLVQITEEEPGLAVSFSECIELTELGFGYFNQKPLTTKEIHHDR